MTAPSTYPHSAHLKISNPFFFCNSFLDDELKDDVSLRSL